MPLFVFSQCGCSSLILIICHYNQIFLPHQPTACSVELSLSLYRRHQQNDPTSFCVWSAISKSTCSPTRKSAPGRVHCLSERMAPGFSEAVSDTLLLLTQSGAYGEHGAMKTFTQNTLSQRILAKSSLLHPCILRCANISPSGQGVECAYTDQNYPVNLLQDLFFLSGVFISCLIHKN